MNYQKQFLTLVLLATAYVFVQTVLNVAGLHFVYAESFTLDQMIQGAAEEADDLPLESVASQISKAKPTLIAGQIVAWSVCVPLGFYLGGVPGAIAAFSISSWYSNCS